MKKTWELGLGVAAMLAASPAMAADHQDGTITAGGALSDPTTDITDVFVWMSSDTTGSAGTVNLIMNVFPGASATSLFSTSAKYVFHTTSQANILATTGVKRDVVCTFAGTTAPQTASCWVTDGATAVADFVTGNASVAMTPLTSASTKVKVFAGPRNDPFFFNLAGFRNAASVVANAVKATVGGSTAYITGFDTASPGCPILTAAGRGAVVSKLTKDCTGNGAAKDFFRVPQAVNNNATCIEAAKPSLVTTLTQNEQPSGIVLSLVVTVDKSLLTLGGTTLSVWGATTK